jgi:periplasmic protein TonB
MSSQLLVKPQEQYQESAAAKTATASVPCLSLVPAQRPMFSQSFVELSSTDRRRKRWTSTSSFIVQALMVTFLFLLPLWITDTLPMQQLATFLVAPPPPPPPPPPAAPMVKAPKVVSQIINGQLLAPTRIPKEVKMIKEETAPPPIQTGVIGGVEGGVPGGQAGGVIGSLLSSVANTAAPVVATPKRLRVSSGITEGMLLHRVEPLYPVIAQRGHIQGAVQLRAIISRDGTIENLQLVSGHPMLVPAAIDAVKQWRYRPYVLNGEPLEVETVVFVNFHLNL